MNDRIPISVCVLSHNEALNLPRCLEALRLCDDVVVVDDGSTDGSQAVARNKGARVVQNPFTSFADQRNGAMQHVKHDWVLHLDADEVVTDLFLAKIKRLVTTWNAHHVGYIARKIMLEERWLKYSADYPVYVPRIVHRAGAHFSMSGHGDVVDSAKHLPVYVSEPIYHYTFSKGWTEWCERHERYARAEAERWMSQGVAWRWADLFSPDNIARRRALRALSFRLPSRPVMRFIYLYVFRRGFLDGRPGLRFSRAMMEYEHMINRQGRALRKARVP